jgi:hypothetical protein
MGSMHTTLWRAISALTIAAAMACTTDESGSVADSGSGEGRLAVPDAITAKTSLVRMVNALPDANGMSVTSDNRSVFSGVDYKAVTQYQEIDQTIARFRLLGAGRDTTIATNDEILVDGSRYTVIALPENDGGVRLRVLKDELEADSGKARLRVVHALQNTGEVDVMLSGRTDPLFDNVNNGSEAGFEDVDAGNSTITVRTSDGKQLFRRQLKLEAGHAYTMVLTSTGNSKVDAITIVDRAAADSAR